MSNVVQLNVVASSDLKKVCGNCRFYRRRSGFDALCDAQGGLYASLAWRNCEGDYWQAREPSLFQRIRAALTGSRP